MTGRDGNLVAEIPVTVMEGNNLDDAFCGVHEICYDMLFPYAGQLVSNLVASCGMPGLVLKKIPIKKESIRFGTPDTVS